MNYNKLFGFFLILASSLFGQHCGCPPLLAPPPLEAGYSASSRIEVDRCWDVFANASFTYWEATQSNMEIGTVSDQSDSFFFLNGNVALLDFGYEPGFKLALGVNLDQDKWDSLLQYTWFRSDVESTIALNPNGQRILYPSWQVPDLLVAYFDGKESWTLNMDLLDIEMGRHYLVGNQLSFRPFFGARAAWISQKVRVNYTNVTNDIFLPRNEVSIKQTSSSWGVGPRTGLETNWPLGKGVRFYGNGSLDILFTQYTKLKFLQQGKTSAGSVISGSVIVVRERDDHHLRAHTDLEFGLGWGTYFSRRRWHIDLTLGYQFQIFFDQNMFRSFIDDQTLGKADSPHGNLHIHGLILQSRWDF